MLLLLLQAEPSPHLTCCYCCCRLSPHLPLVLLLLLLQAESSPAPGADGQATMDTAQQLEYPFAAAEADRCAQVLESARLTCVPRVEGLGFCMPVPEVRGLGF